MKTNIFRTLLHLAARQQDSPEAAKIMINIFRSLLHLAARQQDSPEAAKIMIDTYSMVNIIFLKYILF